LAIFYLKGAPIPSVVIY